MLHSGRKLFGKDVVLNYWAVFEIVPLRDRAGK